MENTLYFIELNKDKEFSDYNNLITLVSPEKQTQILKFRFDVDKKLSLLSDLLVRYFACNTLSLSNNDLEFTKDESVRLLMYAEISVRNYCIITIFLNCALRLSELVSIDIAQIDGNVLTIIGKGDKARKVYLTPSAQKSINNWLVERDNYNPKDVALFITKRGTRISNRAVQDMLKRYLVRAKITAPGITVHKLRHTSATLMYRYGKADIRALQTILGHSDISTTTIYTHTSNDQLQSTVNANPLADMFNK